MANELNCPTGTTGQNVTAKLFLGGAQVGTAISCPEIGATGVYSGQMPTVSAGLYGVVFYVGAAIVGAGSIAWDGTKEITLLNVSSGGGGGGEITGVSTEGAVALRNALAGLPLATIGLLTLTEGTKLPLVQGDDYNISDGTAIPLLCPSPTLVGWTPELAIQMYDVSIALTGSVITDASATILIEMTAAQSGSLPSGAGGTFTLRFTKDGRDHTTTVGGIVTVAARIA